MKTKIKLGLLPLLVVLFAMLPMVQVQAADKLQARYDVENCYEGDLQYIKVKVLNPEPGETFTYRWKFHTFGGWSYWGASGNWYTGGETDTIAFQTDIGDATCDWEDEWGWLEHGVEIKSSTGRKLTIESIYRPQPMEKYPVYTIIFTGLEEPKVGQKLDGFVESLADYAFTPLGIIWYKGWDDSTSDGYVGPDTIVTSGKYRCRLYFDMVSPYKLGDDANAAVNYSNGIIKYDSEIEKYYILKTYTAIEPVAATITKQPVSSRGSLSTGARFTIAADNAQSYCWQLYVNNAWHDLANSNTANYLIFPGKIGDYTLRCKITSTEGVVSYSNSVSATIYNDAKVSQSAKYVYEGQAVDIAVTDVGCSAKVKYYEWLWKNDKMTDWELCENYEEYFDDDYKTGKLKYRYATEDMLQYHPRFYCLIFFEDGLGTMESEVVWLWPSWEMISDGIHKTGSELWYYKDGEKSGFTGIVQDKGVFYYIVKGVVDESFTGLYKNGDYFWYIENGIINKTYRGIVENSSGMWYVENGKINTGFTGLCKYNDIFYGVRNGKVDTNYTGLIQNAGYWWYVVNGVLDTTYEGIVVNDGGTWVIKTGKLNTDANGIVSINGKFYYVKGGKVQVNFTGIVGNAGAYWYIVNGVLDGNYTGLVDYNGAKWYVVKGKLNTTATEVTIGGVTYKLSNGKVVG